MHATRALIHLDLLRSNIAAVKAFVGGRRICFPVKADAYGHGAVPVASAALGAGVDFLAVATVQEGEELRRACIQAPIILLSLPSPEELPALIASRLTPMVADAAFARELDAAAAAAGTTLPIHLKIDTGMGRIGCRPENAPGFAAEVAALRSLRIEGTATHLAASDSRDGGDLAYTERQIDAFESTIAAIRAAGIDPGILHAANSGGVALHPRSWFDMVRPGLALYGYPPVDGLDGVLKVSPVMELESRLVFIKPVRAGESVSYGRIWTADRDTVIGTIPVGYADGLPRGLSNRLTVIVGGRAFPQVGRICMDQCMVDLGPDSSARKGDRVVLFGPGPGVPSAADLAREHGTIPYEITCGINKRVPRVYRET